MADEQLKQSKIIKDKAPKVRKEKIAVPVEAVKKEEKAEEEKIEIVSEKKEETKTEQPKEKKKIQPKVKKTEAIVNAYNVPISLKHAIGIGRYIKYKKISYAIELLEKVSKKKLAVPMKGELPHRKGKTLEGKSMMSGSFPVNASREFITILKTLNANCNANGMDLEKTIITEVIPNKAPVRFHRFGSTHFKMIHVFAKAKEIEPKAVKKKLGEKK